MSYKKKTKQSAVIAAAVIVVPKPVEVKPVEVKPVTPVTTITPEKVDKNCVLRARAFLLELKTQYILFRKYMPLGMGIEKELHEKFPHQSKRIINTALYLHTHNHNYLKRLQEGNSRFNLEGAVISAVDDTAKQLAKQSLTKIKQKVTKKKVKK